MRCVSLRGSLSQLQSASLLTARSFSTQRPAHTARTALATLSRHSTASSTLFASPSNLYSVCTTARSFHSAVPRLAEEAAAAAAPAEGETPAEPVKTDAKEILAFLTKLKLADHAEKFTSFNHLLHIRTWELKAFGLNVKQRKSLLKLIDKYRVSIRVRRANQFIYACAHELTPEELQAGVYKIIYAHIYQRLDWVDQNTLAERQWKANVDSYHSQRHLDHNLLRGLREPELMEMAKVEAGLVAAELKALKEKKAKEDEEKKKREEAEAAQAKSAEAQTKEEADKINAVKDEEVDEVAAPAKKEEEATTTVVDAKAAEVKTPESKE